MSDKGFLDEAACAAAWRPCDLAGIVACRTPGLGGHLDRCTACGFETPAYNSCRNRHCPKCQASTLDPRHRVGDSDSRAIRSDVLAKAAIRADHNAGSRTTIA
jgi:hypothetical protein